MIRNFGGVWNSSPAIAGLPITEPANQWICGFSFNSAQISQGETSHFPKTFDETSGNDDQFTTRKRKRKRLSSLDHFRGLALFLMILVNSLSPYNVPKWLKHSPWNGYQFPDLVAPLFLFAMGVAYRISLQRRLSRFGIKKTLFHFIKRYVILFLFGFLGILLVKRSFDWGILQMLGAVGLFILPIMFLSPLCSIITSFILLIFYQISMNVFGLSDFILKFDMGGPFSTLSWAFIPVFAASFVGVEVFSQKNHTYLKKFLLVGIMLSLAGFAESYFIPFNKHLVSSSYILFSTGLATILFSVFYILVEICKFHIDIFNALGKNSLVIFMFTNIISTILSVNIPKSLPIIYPILATIGLLVISIIIAKIFMRYEIYIKL